MKSSGGFCRGSRHCAYLTETCLCSYFPCIMKVGIQINPDFCFKERWHPVFPLRVPAGWVGFQLAQRWLVGCRTLGWGVMGFLPGGSRRYGGFLQLHLGQRRQLSAAGSCLSNDNSLCAKLMPLILCPSLSEDSSGHSCLPV